MGLRRRPLVLGIVLGAPVALPAYAQDAAGATAPVLKLRGGILDLARQGWPPPQAQVLSLVDQTFDMSRIARGVLGKNVSVSPEQEARVLQVLRSRMAQQMVRFRPNPGDGFAVTETRPAGAAEWLIFTRSVPPGEAGARDPVVVAWRVAAASGTPPRIVDLQRDGVSAVATQRDDLAASLRRLGLNEAIAEMERRAALPPKD